MRDVVAVLVAVVAAFVLSGVWYAMFGARLASLHEAYGAARSRPAAATAVVELVRNLLLAVVVVGLAARADVAGPAAGALFGLVLWLGFPAVILAGSVFHERVPAALAGIHAGDWLLKLVAVAVIAAAFA